MDLHQFFTASRLLVVAGKGGVGKTTVSAVLASAAARSGLRVLLVDLDGTARVPALVGVDGPFDYAGTAVACTTSGDGPPGAGTGTITGTTIRPSDALVEYLDDHGLRRVSRRLANTGIIDVVSTAAPGIDDILVLGKLKQLERNLADVDLIVVDGPAAGHAITFLQAASGLDDAVKTGPISAQAKDVLKLLGNPSRCQVVLVTLPETTPVNELVETAFALEDRVGVQLAPVVVNGVDGAVGRTEPAVTGAVPDGPVGDALRAAHEFRTARARMHAAEVARLAAELPLPQLHLPLLPTAGLSPADIPALADALLAGIEALPAPPGSATRGGGKRRKERTKSKDRSAGNSVDTSNRVGDRPGAPADGGAAPDVAAGPGAAAGTSA